MKEKESGTSASEAGERGGREGEERREGGRGGEGKGRKRDEDTYMKMIRIRTQRACSVMCYGYTHAYTF